MIYNYQTSSNPTEVNDSRIFLHPAPAVIFSPNGDALIVITFNYIHVYETTMWNEIVEKVLQI